MKILLRITLLLLAAALTGCEVLATGASVLITAPGMFVSGVADDMERNYEAKKTQEAKQERPRP